MRKSFIKTIEWRALALIVDFLIVLTLTGNYEIASAVSIVSSTIKTIVFYFWYEKNDCS